MTDPDLAQRVEQLEREVATLRRALETAEKWRIQEVGSDGTPRIVPGNPRYELKVSPIYKALREGDSGSE